MRAAVITIACYALGGVGTAVADDVLAESFTERPSSPRQDPGCTSGQDECSAGSSQFAGSVVIGRVPPHLGHVAVVATGWGMAFRDQQVDVSQGIASLGLRAWVAPAVWLQWGFGAATGDVSGDAPGVRAIGAPVLPAAMLGLGVDLAASDHLDVQLSVHGGSALDEGRLDVYHLSVGLDVSWR